jgi:hypothetical protein
MQIYHSEKLDLLSAALVKAQAEFPTLQKNKTVTVKHKNGGGQHSFPYAELSYIVETLKPILARHDLGISQMLVGKGLNTTIIHSSGQFWGSTVELNLTGGAMERGSEVTYFRRYALTAALGLVSDEDDGGKFAQPGARDRATPRIQQKPWGANAHGVRKQEIEKLFQTAKSNGWSREEFFALGDDLGLEDLTQCDRQQYETLWATVQKAPSWDPEFDRPADISTGPAPQN